MNYFVDKKFIRFVFSGQDGPQKASISIEGIESHLQFLEKITLVMCNSAEGKSNYTQLGYVSSLKKLFLYVKHRNGSLPVSPKDWNEFIFAFMSFYMSTNIAGGSVGVRLETWQYRISPFLELLRQQSIIPYAVIIPRVNIKTENYSSSLKKTLRQLRYDPASLNTPANKLLVDTSFAMRDEEFLENINDQCRVKIDFLKKILLTHWNNFLSDHSIYEAMKSEVSSNELNKIFNKDASIKASAPKGFKYICSPSRKGSVNWAFAIVEQLLMQGSDVDCISLKRLRSLPYFKSNALGTHDYKNILEKKTAMPLAAFKRLSSSNVLYRFAGILSSVEISVISSILIIEHPNFNPLSIANSKISSKNGKSCFVYTDDSDKFIFSVDKPRAGSRKSAVLSELAGSVIATVLALTAPIRKILRMRGDPDSEYLFLGTQRGGRLGRNIANLTDSLTSDKGQTLCRLYPELTHNGLARGTLSFRSIRNTMGVLRWFETGSISEMSRALGNTENVVLESYLPPDILHAWNTRIIRRHQNTLIILAAHNEDYLQDVTDFPTKELLVDFISQLLLENKQNSNILANEVNRRLQKNKSKDIISAGILNVKLCEKSLAYLYAFHDWMTENYSNKVSGKMKDLMELSIFIKHTCESIAISNEVSSIVDIRALKEIHLHALKLKQNILLRVNFNIVDNFEGAKKNG